MNNTVIIINKSQFECNLKSIRKFMNKNTKFCLPVKANAYGHDLQIITKIANPYVDYFGVSSITEAINIREIGINTPILAFGSFSQDQISKFIEYNVDITIS